MKTNWEKLVATAPAHVIPKQDSGAYRLLMALAEGEVSEDGIAAIAGRNYRSPLQQLMGKKYGWFLIHSTIGEDGNISGRYLDLRHLSEQWDEDASARAERRKEWAEISYREATQGAEREKAALRELIRAEDLDEEIKKILVANKQNGTPEDADANTF
ncbi:hypothetical protein [Atlantibacter hermannii]|uniref:hypothetical protein n=1 Tax=Atlantibacter hermannii TaxID=565 RepID=UPI0028A8486A|nr:hypothetical protein [Atlantibacter hermannii]